MGHFYDTEGKPKHEIQGKNGKMRSPYWHEAVALKLAPGVTSITSQLRADSIKTYEINKLLQKCVLEPFDAMCHAKEAWIERMLNYLKYESDRITNQGKYIHNALEKYYLTGKIDDKWREYIVPVIELIERRWPMLKRTDWIPERSFQYNGIYGGCVDISTEYDGGIILDFKTKDSEDIKKFKAYKGHHQQLVAYAYGLRIPSAKCGNIFLSALKPNILCLEMHDREVLDTAWTGFKYLAQYWHLENFRQLIQFKE